MADHLHLEDVSDLKRAAGKCSLRCVRELVPLVIKLRGSHLPGDQESAIEHVTRSELMFKSEPGHEILSLQGKYKPWKDSMLTHWTRLQKPAVRVRPSSSAAVQPCTPDEYLSRGRKMLPVILASLIDMDNDPQQAWSDNCGRGGVGRFLGWLPLCGRLGLIAGLQHVQPSQRKGKKILKLGVNRACYVLLPNGEEPVHQELAKFAQAGDIFRAACPKPLRTASQWCAAHHSVVEDHHDSKRNITI